MSARIALIDIVTAGRVQRDVLDDAGRQVLAERAVDHADQLLLTVTGAPESPG